MTIMLGSMVAGRHGMAAVAENFTCRDNNEEDRKLNGNGICFGNINVYPQRHTPSNKAMSPNLSQIVPPTADQEFKYKSLLGPLSLKSPQVMFF